MMNWQSMEIHEKLPYIISSEDREDKYEEFTRYGASGGEDCIAFDTFNEKLIEFQSEKQISEFWKYCDMNVDDFVCFEEYLFCRGEYELNGSRYGYNEYEFADKILSSEIQDLLEEDIMRQRLLEYTYDEDGIIIDP